MGPFVNPASSAFRTRIRAWLERAWHGSYYRLASVNYQRRLLPTPQRTPGGWIRTFDLYNRHGRHAMLRQLCESCGPEDVVYDVGASVGIYALAVAAGGPDRRVRAYEPSPPTVERLRANLERNECGDRVEVRPVGLGATTDARTFYVSTYPELSGVERESATRWGGAVAAEHEIPVRRLDDEVASGPAPDVLKVDVEGSGAEVLRGGIETLQTHRPTVFVEVHEDGLTGDRPAAIRKLLDEAGYAIEKRERYWTCEPRA